MKCIECGRKIGILDEKCPFCGAGQYDDNALDAEPKQKAPGTPAFTEEEQLVYGIHPDDEMYRKTMELNLLAKNYK